METWTRSGRAATSARSPTGLLSRATSTAFRGGETRAVVANWQPWDFVVVTDRAQLVEPRAGVAAAGHVARSTATVAVILPDLQERREVAFFDAGQAVFSMMVAAADLGIGSGHSAVADQELARRVLGHPDDRVCAHLVVLGYPADRPLVPLRRPDRRAFDDVVHRGRW